MKVTYECPKGQRIKKGSTKVEFGFNGEKMKRRINNFYGLTCLGDFVYGVDIDRWLLMYDDTSNNCFFSSTHNDNITNVKSAIRHIRKHDEIPKGTRFRLCSNFKGYNIFIIK